MIRSSLLAMSLLAMSLLAGIGAAIGVIARPPTKEARAAAPRYDAAGRLVFPADYREWVFVSSGLDMSYSQRAASPAAHVFGNVFAPPAAYRQFKETGHWPDRTVLILENRAGSTAGSINKAGQFQTGVLGLEAHVRDTARFKGGWGFFAFDGAKPAERIDYRADCYSCHRANAAVDTTFVQFYPTLLPIALARKSVAPALRADAVAIAGR